MNASGNAILRALPLAEMERLKPYLRHVPLMLGQPIYRPDEPLGGIWFPQSGAVSRLVQLPAGETVEAGIVGNDGVVGLPLALGASNGIGQCRVYVEGTAWFISATDFHEQVASRRGPLLDVLLAYTNLFILTLGQLTACHCLHRIEQRLSRCILTLHDYSPENELRITHDSLAEFLGVHRPSITNAVQAFVAQGAIVSERRRIVVTNRDALLRDACACYSAIRDMTQLQLSRVQQSFNGSAAIPST